MGKINFKLNKNNVILNLFQDLPNRLKKRRFFTAILFILLITLIITSIVFFDKPKKALAGDLYLDYDSFSVGNTWNRSQDITVFDNVIVDGKTLILYGEVTIKNLTIKNGGKVTHAPINPNKPLDSIDGEDSAATDNNKMGNKFKIVDLTVTGKLTLESGGSINVDGKGYPGGVLGGDGFSPTGTNGGGKGSIGGIVNGSNINSAAAGGGGYRGNGGNGSNKEVYLGKAGGSSYAANIGVGSGGGGAYWNKPAGSGGRGLQEVRGGAGGGRINLNVYEIEVDSISSKISANGTDAKKIRVINEHIYAGGGSGGYININTDNFIYLSTTSLTPISVNAGSSGIGATDGEKSIAAGKIFYNISADGGKTNTTSAYGGIPLSGGGGGGGYISVFAKKISTNKCLIGPGVNLISDECENQDVTINDTTVYADSVVVKDTGDTKRHFNSLTITNNAVLTHRALNGSEMDDVNTTKNYVKVDLEIATNLILTDGGKINVDAKGYLGSYMATGCNGEVGHPSDPIGAGLNKDYGFGPGGGQGLIVDPYTRDRTNGYGAGGGYGGAGGQGWRDGSPLDYGPVYNSGPSVDFGSGGGGAWDYDERDGSKEDETCFKGGTGGGRVMLKIKGDLKIDSTSEISANGGDALDTGAKEGNPVDGGGGSGGVIKIDVATITNPAGPGSYEARVNGGLTGSRPGRISDLENFSPYQLSANGGNFHGNLLNPDGGGGGGGWIVIKIYNSGGGGGGTITPAAANITGNIYSRNVAPLVSKNYNIEGGSIVAGGAVAATCKNSSPDKCYKLASGSSGYTTSMWDNITEDMSATIARLTPQATLITDNSATLGALSGTTKNPEGGIWKYAGNLSVSGDYTGRGTIVVNGDLTITGDMKKSGDANLGFIVTGTVTLTSAVSNLEAAIYSTGSVDMVAVTKMTFSGLIVTKGAITLPSNSAGKTIIAYDQALSKNPLPGFANLQNLIISNTAP